MGEQEKNVEVNKTISKKEDDGSHGRSVNSMSVKKETVSGTQEVYSSKDKTTIVDENMDNKGQPDKETRKGRQGKEDRQGDKKEQKKNKQASNKEDHDIFGDVPQPKETNEINQCEDTLSRSKNGEQKVEDKEHKLLGQYDTDKQNESAKKEKDSKLFISKKDETSQVEKDSEVKRKSTSKSNMKKSSSENENKKTNKTDDNKQEMPTKEYTKMQNSENYTREEKEEDQKDDLSSRTKTALPIGTEEDLVIKETPEKQSNGNQKKEIQTSLELKEKESKENKKKENQTSEESNIKESKNNQTSVESKVNGSKGKESENVNQYDECGHKFLQNEMSPKPDSVKQQISDSH